MRKGSTAAYSGVFRALAARSLTFPIGAIATLLSTSLTIGAIGGTNFGTLSVVSTLSTLLLFADLGFGAGVINQIATGDMERSRKVTSAAFRALWIPSSAICLIGVGGASLFSWSGVLGLTGLEPGWLNLATAGCLVAFGISVPFGLGQRILVGLGKNDLAVLLGMSASIFTLAYTSFLVLMSAPAVLFALSLPLGTLVANIIAFIVGKRAISLRGSNLFRGRLSGEYSALFGQGTPMLIIMIALPIMFSSHRVILSRQSSPMEVASYSLAMQFYTPIWSFISIAGTALWPIFAARRSRGESSSLGTPAFIFAALGLVAGMGIVAFGSPIGRIISHDQVQLPPSILVAIAALILMQAIQQVPGMFLTDQRGLWFQAVCVSLAAPVSLGISWLLAPKYGAPAPLLVTAFCVLFFQYIPGVIVAWRRSRHRQE